MENMSLIKDLVLVVAAIITAGSAAVTACAARKGISNWIVELRGRTNFEVAHGLLLATYKLRNAVRSCRSQLISPAEEFPDNYPLLNATPEQELNAWAYLFKNRGAPVWEACQDYNARALEAEALWGPKIREITDKFLGPINEWYRSIEVYLENLRNQGETVRDDKTFSQEIRSTVFDTNPDNKLSKSIAKVIEEIKQEVSPHIGPK